MAVDSSPEMLEVARSRLAGFGNVECRQGRIEELPLESASLDLALVVHLLHHVADPRPPSPRSRACCDPAAGS